jgi:phosphate transport system ATP-binding protein
MMKIRIKGLSLWFGKTKVLDDVNMEIPEKKVTAIIGPSGCGKTTLLRAINRMHDLVMDVKIKGSVYLDGTDIYGRQMDIVRLRTKVGMVFQHANPFPKSVFENVAYGLRIHGIKGKEQLYEKVKKALIDAALWDEVKERLSLSATKLSGGQKQRLCIARAIALEPEVLLMDEPASAIDPISTQKIEELIHRLKEKYTIVIVTHNMQQAARVSDYTAFLLYGKVIEFAPTEVMFTKPKERLTEEYVTGRFG